MFSPNFDLTSLILMLVMTGIWYILFIPTVNDYSNFKHNFRSDSQQNWICIELCVRRIRLDVQKDYNNLGSNELGRLDKGQSILCNTMYYYGSLLDILPARFMLPHWPWWYDFNWLQMYMLKTLHRKTKEANLT